MYRHLFGALTAILTIMWVGAAQAEDVAIVVGIGDYLNFPDAHLGGIDNDVTGMVAALKNAGFQPIRLFNTEATEYGIHRAFADAAKRVHAGDRFVYYQSGHGSRNYHLLTYDTTVSGDHVLGKSDIQQLMAGIHTHRKSLILDACFSGGFKDRGDRFHQVKFYPIESLKYATRPDIRDRTDTVVRTLVPNTGSEPARRDFVVFASSQDDQPSQVDRIDGTVCSVFTHFLTQQLNANRNASWNAVVQPTIADVLHSTHNQQTPAFGAEYLPYRIYTTDERANEPGGAVTVAIRNMAQLYDINNVVTSRLDLSASLADAASADGELYHPDTRVRLNLWVGTGGYLFVINRDDEDNAQMVGWGTEDLDLSQPEKMVDQSYISRPDAFEFGKGTLKITTSRRNGIEYWKAFLFTNREDALKFAQMWLALVTDRGNKVHLTSFANAKLDRVTRIGIASPDGRALYTSEIHYRVTDR